QSPQPSGVVEGERVDDLGVLVDDGGGHQLTGGDVPDEEPGRGVARRAVDTAVDRRPAVDQAVAVGEGGDAVAGDDVAVDLAVRAVGVEEDEGAAELAVVRHCRGGGQVAGG